MGGTLLKPYVTRAGSTVTFPTATRAPGASYVAPLRPQRDTACGENTKSLGMEWERLEPRLARAARTGSGARNLFPGLFLTTPSPTSVPYVSFSAPVMRVRQHRLGAQDQPRCPRHRAVTPGEARLGWGPARGRGRVRGGCATAGTRSSLGSARRKWLGASAVAMHTLKGGGQRLRLGSLFGESGWIFSLPHSQPFPPPAAWGPLGYSQSRSSLMPFHPFCYSASPFCCSASQEEEGTGRHPCTLHLKPKGRAGVFSVMSGKQLNRLINQQEGYQQDGVFNKAGFQQAGGCRCFTVQRAAAAYTGTFATPGRNSYVTHLLHILARHQNWVEMWRLRQPAVFLITHWSRGETQSSAKLSPPYFPPFPCLF